MRFTLADRGASTSLILPSAKAALETRAAREAVRGAELRDDGGTVIAVKERIDIADGWILAWRLTPAWTEPMPPRDLEIDHGAGVDDDGHPAAE